MRSSRSGEHDAPGPDVVTRKWGAPPFPAERLRRPARDLLHLVRASARWANLSSGEVVEDAARFLLRWRRLDAVHIHLLPSAGKEAVVASEGEYADDLRAALGRMPPGLRAGRMECRVSSSGLSIACVPLGRKGALGSLAVASQHRQFPDPDDVGFLSCAQEVLTSALGQEELRERLPYIVRERKHLAARQSILAGMGHPRALRARFDRWISRPLSKLREELGTDCCGVFEVAHDRASLRRVAELGWPRQAATFGTLAIEEGSEIAYALRSEGPLVVRDFRKEGRFRTSSISRECGFVSALLVPVHDGSGPRGLLCTHGYRSRSFSRADVNFLQSVANLVSASYRQRRLAEERKAAADRAAALERRTMRVLADARAEFLARASHELRTPVNGITGYLELLELGVYGELSEGQRSAISRVRGLQEYLGSIITSSLDLANLRRGTLSLDIRDVRLEDALKAAEELIRPSLSGRKLRYERSPGATSVSVRADPDRLQQILLNLLSNAVKFTEPPGVVRVECTADDTAARIHVGDTGPGIPAEEVERIFEPFFQVGQGGAGSEGSGLGLSIAQELAEAMGGSISVESRPGEGSVFTVELPRRR